MSTFASELQQLEHDLRRMLALDHPYAFRLPSLGRESAVLVLFAHSRELPGSRHLLMIERGKDLPHHQGQPAFPGGMRDPDDTDLLATALREAEEELAIPPQAVRILGSLPVLNTLVTGFLVTPVVATLQVPLEEIPLRPDPTEIARVEWLLWSELTDPARYRQEPVIGRLWKTDVFEVAGLRIWGATGAMVRNLVERWRRVDERP